MKQAKNTKRTQAYKDATVNEIAQRILDIDTLQTRNNDSLDFHEVAVWTIKEALEAAFEAGRKADH
jgi:sulfate adenylyltransferase subunit 1 (EFTu-like GTPase family)